MLVLWLLACAPEKQAGPAATDDPSPTTSSPCAADEVLDGDRCLPAACGVGTWGGRTGDVYVDAAATAGDGTEAAPFATLTEAVDALADAGGTVQIAEGSYLETLSLGGEADGLVLNGRCAELVTLDASAGEDDSVALLLDARHATEVQLGGMVIRGGKGGGIGILGGVLTLTEVALAENRRFGLYLDSSAAEVSATALRITDTTPPRGDTSGRGVHLQRGARLDCADCTVERSVEAGLFVVESSVVLEGGGVFDTETTPGGSFGMGIELALGSDATLTDVTVEGSHYLGIEVDGSTLSASGVVVSGTATTGDGEGGAGLYLTGDAAASWTGGSLTQNEVYQAAVEEGGTLTLTDTTISGGGGTGRGLLVSGGEATLTDTTLSAIPTLALSVTAGEAHLVRVVVDGTLPSAEGARGVEVSGHLDAVDSTIRNNAGLGLLVRGAGAEGVLDGCVVSGSQLSGEEGGYGLGVSGGGRLEVQNTEVTNNVELGIWVTDGGQATLDDVTVSGTLPDAYDENGIGLAVTDGGSVAADGLVIVENQTLGVLVDGGTAGFTDLTVSDTRVAVDGGYGRGMTVQGGAVVEVHGGSFVRNHQMAVVVSSPGSSLLVDGLTLTDTADADQEGYAVGLQVEDGAGVSGSGLTVDGARGLGVLAYDGAEVDLAEVVVRGVVDAGGSAGHGVVVQDATARLTGLEVEEVDGIGLILSGPEGRLELGSATIQAIARTDVYTAGFGLVVQSGATVDATDLAISEIEGPGLVLADTGVLRCTRCVLAEVGFAGLVQMGGSVGLDAVEIESAREDAQLGGGVGLFVAGGDDLDLTGSRVGETPLGAVWVTGPVAVRLVDDDLTAGPGTEVSSGVWAAGAAVYATDGDPMVEGCWLHDGRFGVLLDGTSATLADNTWSDLDTTLHQQGCTDEAAPTGWESVPDASLCEGADALVVPVDFTIQFEEVTPVEG